MKYTVPTKHIKDKIPDKRLCVSMSYNNPGISLPPGAYERREGASNSSGIYVPSVVESHLCKLPYKENLCTLRK